MLIANAHVLLQNISNLDIMAMHINQKSTILKLCDTYREDIDNVSSKSKFFGCLAPWIDAIEKIIKFSMNINLNNKAAD
jgi:hypothetical protein